MIWVRKSFRLYQEIMKMFYCKTLYFSYVKKYLWLKTVYLNSETFDIYKYFIFIFIFMHLFLEKKWYA